MRVESDVLVLNSSFIPIRMTSVREAICLIFEDKAYSVLEENDYIHSPSIKIRVPNVIALKHFHDFPQRKVKFSRLNVIYRDDMTCQFCGKRFSIKELTVDHVIPRSRWEKGTSPTIWTNVVCACVECNRKKGNRLVSELGWKVLKEPKEPEYMPYFTISFNKAEKRGWLPFCKFNVRLVQSL